MSASNELPPKVVPAQLGFLAIYNPSLGSTDDTFENQVVYYTSQAERNRSRKNGVPGADAEADAAALREENNEQLRQIGLAQGMVEFGRSFSDGRSVDTIETEKARIVLHELELGWWVIASINLTVLPVAATKSQTKGKAGDDAKLEYSSREVKPAILLLGDLLRAHSTFLLHHASSMSALFVRTRRPKFMGILGRYWDTFLSTWSVLMHGNPARNLYGGIKIAACGELGIGVGEEDRGSGEREVLEGLVGRIDGLVDVIVSKFGDGDPGKETSGMKTPTQAQPISPWLGSGNEPTSEDGTIFLGTGALSRKSIRDISHWIEDLYRWGPYTYGVIDNPTSNRRTKRWKLANSAKKRESVPAPNNRTVPPPVFNPALRNQTSQHQKSDKRAATPQLLDGGGDGSIVLATSSQRRPSLSRGPSSFASSGSESKKSGNKLLQYMKLGYGTHWSLGGSSLPAEDGKESSESPNGTRGPSPTRTVNDNSTSFDGISDVPPPKNDWDGQFLIGLMGDVEEAALKIDKYGPTESGENQEGDNNRVLLRTLTLELEREEDARAEIDISIDLGNRGTSSTFSRHPASDRTGTSNASFESQDRNKTKKLRVVVYVKRPFIFVMLFELRSEVLALASLYRSLHQQISPLVKPLLTSTIFRALKPDMPAAGDATPIYDLIWDPKLLTITSNIPNIPDPYLIHPAASYSLPWSRIEALSTHMQIISTYIATTTEPLELERTCKTSRGWWVVWTKIPDPDPPTIPLTSGAVSVPSLIAEESNYSSQSPQRRWGKSRGTSTFATSMISGPAHPFLETVNSGDDFPKDKEIFLVRRASDHVATRTSRFTNGSTTPSSESWTANPGKLVQGIGVDTKWYIDTLLNLSR